MARNISTPILKELVDISKGIVWCIREPQIQISSQLTRIANDLVYEAGADVISMDELTDEQIRMASDFLENGPKSTNFSKTSWEDIGLHFSLIDDAVTSIVIDGSVLTQAPEPTLHNAASALGLQYSDRMITGWVGEFINANTGYNSDLTDDTHAWTKDAVVSEGIRPASTKSLELERMPINLQAHLARIAIPTYRRMMGYDEYGYVI